MIAMNAAVKDHPDLPPVLAAVQRSLRRPQSAGFTQSLLNSIEQTEVRTPAGIVLGLARTYDFETARLDKVIARTARGLYWHELGLLIPREFGCVAYGLHGFPDGMPDVLEFFGKAFSGKRNTFGRDTFSYWLSIMVEKDGSEANPPSTLWGFSFFSKVLFAAMIAPNLKVDEFHRVRLPSSSP
jgi:hypothetical protein